MVGGSPIELVSSDFRLFSFMVQYFMFLIAWICNHFFVKSFVIMYNYSSCCVLPWATFSVARWLAHLFVTLTLFRSEHSPVASTFVCNLNPVVSILSLLLNEKRASRHALEKKSQNR
jgi:hypothetical protein